MNKFKLDHYVRELSNELDLSTVEQVNFVERILEQVWIDGYSHHMYESETYEKDSD